MADRIISSRHPVGLGDNIDFSFEGNHMKIIDLFFNKPPASLAMVMAKVL